MATGGVGLQTPANLRTQSVGSVEIALLQKRWEDNKLYMESVFPDPLFNSEGLIRPVEVGSAKNIITLPKSELFIDCTAKDRKGNAARSVELVMLKALSGAPVEGNAADILGQEQTPNIKFTTAYANDWATGVVKQLYGIDFREMSPYDVNSKIRELLGQWLAEIRGYYARQALCQGHSNNIAQAPVSLPLGLNPNFYFPGLDEADQPLYDSTLADYENAIGEAQAAAYGATNCLTVTSIMSLVEWARTEKYMIPAKLGGGDGLYALYVHPDEWKNLRLPANQDSWGRYYYEVASTDDLDKVVPGTKKLVIGGECVVMRDDRCPTVTFSGNSVAASGWEMAFGYEKAGRSGTRATARTSGNYNANLFLCAGALLKYEPELPHYEEQPDVYKKYMGDGLFGAVGYKLPVWNIDSGTDTSAQQETSAVIPTSRR